MGKDANNFLLLIIVLAMGVSMLRLARKHWKEIPQATASERREVAITYITAGGCFVAAAYQLVVFLRHYFGYL